MKDKNLWATLKKDVASLLVSSQFGLEPDKLRRDYASMLGHPLPLKELGFRNVMDMVKEMPDVVSVTFNSDGGMILKAVGCDVAKNIVDLVSKQKKKKKKKGDYFAPCFSHFSHPVPRRHNPPPVLPAHLRAQIHVLLSKGPILLSQLEGYYHHCFGYRLYVQNFGFFSIVEMLVSASDFVTVQQSRLGTVLHLRRPMPLSSAHTFPKETSAGLKPGVSSGQPDIQVKQCLTSSVTENTTSDSVTKESTNEPEVDVKSHMEHQRAPVFHEQVLKLEGEFRQQILQNGLAGCISQELKDKLKKVVGRNRDGIALHNIPEEYKRVFGEALPLTRSGFLSITELISAMDDTFHLMPDQNNEHHWIVTNKEPDQCQQSYYLNSEESLWEQEQQDEHVTNVEDDVAITNLNCKTQEKEFLQPEIGLVIQVCSNPDVPPDAIQSQHFKPPTKHGVRDLVGVLVENVESPGNFYIRYSEGEEGKALEEMMIEMRRCYKSPDVSQRYSLPEPFVRQGQVCCVSPKGMWFYRVVLSKIISLTQVKVYFVDFGDTATVGIASLKFLKSCFGILPAQAVPSTLAGIKPKDGTWSTEATRCFQEMCSNRILVGALNCYIGDWLQLYLCDTHADDDLYIHSALLIQGHGVPSLCSVSAKACLPPSPVSLYMGDGKPQLPNVEWKRTPSKPVDPLKQMPFTDLKIDDEELPPLEFVVGSVIQDENPFQALIADQTKFVIQQSSAVLPPGLGPSPPLQIQ
ncbi:tudor domain-containing protein 5 [Synchiropus picturatus]